VPTPVARQPVLADTAGPRPSCCHAMHSGWLALVSAAARGAAAAAGGQLLPPRLLLAEELLCEQLAE
jgi:hypothetical protein